jgi:hypothetical protein
MSEDREQKVGALARAAGSFEDLEVFKRAYRVSLEVHKKSLRFPALEQGVLGIRCAGRRSRSAPTLPKVLRASGPCAGGLPSLPDDGDGLGRRDAAMEPLLSGSGLYRGGNVEGVARRVSGDCQDAAGPDALAALSLLSVLCPLSSVLRTGSGAFRRPVKGARKGFWRHRK